MTKQIQEHEGSLMAPLSLIEVQPGFNVRENTMPDQSLLDSVKSVGVQRPLHVRPNPDKDGHYFIVDGERRYNAALAAGLDDVRVVIEDCDDASALLLSLVSNDNSKPFTAREEATAFKRLSEAGADLAQIAEVMGRSERKVEETLRALDSGDETLIEGVTTEDPEKKIPARAAARAASLPAEKRAKVAKEIKGKTAKEGVAVVRAAEKEEGIQRRGRKAKEYPWSKNARSLAEILEKAAKSLIKDGGPGNRRAEHHLEVIEVLKGTKEAGDLYVSIMEEKQKEEAKKAKATKKAPSKKTVSKPVAKKVTKKKVAKKAVSKKAVSKKAPAKKKVLRKKKASLKLVASN